MSTHSDSFPHPLTSQVRPALPMRPGRGHGRGLGPHLHLRRPPWSTRAYWTKHRVSRAAAIVLLCFFGTWLLYLVAANVFVKTHALRSLANANPDKIEIDYADAWTMYPGQFHVDEFRLRASDDNIQWVLRVDHADAHIAILPLLHKRFELTKVVGKGLAIRVRHRLEPKDLDPRVVAALPPVDGFADPPLAPTVKKPPPTDAEYDLFTIQLEDVDAEGIREVWIDDVHYTGDTHAHGRFFLKPIRRVDVGPVHAEVHTGEVRVGKYTVAQALHGTMDAIVLPFDPREAHGESVFEQFTTSIDLDGRLESARFASFWLRGESPPVIEGGSGPVHTHVVVERGVLASGSEITATANDLSVAYAGWKATVAARIVGQVKQPPGGERAAFVTLELPGTLARDGWEKEPFKARTVTAFARVTDVDLTHGLHRASLGFDVPDAELPDVRVITSYFKTPNLEVARGSARIATHALFDTTSKVGKADLAMSFRDLDLRYQDRHLAANAYLDARADRIDAVKKVIDLSGTGFQVTELAAPAHDAPRAWWGRVDLTKAKLDFGGERGATFDAEVAARGRDGRPLVSFLPLDYPNWVTGLFDLDGLAGSTHMTVGKNAVDVGPFELHGGSFEVDGRFAKRAEHKSGAFLVRHDLLTVAIDLRDDGAKLVPLGATTWYRDNVARVR